MQKYTWKMASNSLKNPGKILEFCGCGKVGTLHAAVMCQICEKLVEGELWAEVTVVTIWGHNKILPGMCQVI